MGYFGIPFRNGVPIGLGSVASFGAQQFDPSSLFIGGTAGTWYDPSDPTTLFTTSTGTTPCAVPGSGSQVLVGLMLDKSQGAPGALGAELVVNGSFAVDADWIKEPGWSISGGQATKVAGAAGSLYQGAPAMVQGRLYQITFSVTGYSAGTLTPFCRGTVGTGVTANGTYTQRLIAGADSAYAINFFAGATFAGSIDNISVREIPGNHAIAFNNTTARPELSARVNLLTYSEQFENGVWLKITSGTGSIPAVTPNAGTAPDGTNTADLVVFNRGAGNTISDYSWMYQSTGATLTAGASYRGGIYAKAATSGDVGKTLILRHVAGADITITLTADWQLVSGAQTAAGVSSSLDIINRGTTGNSVSVLLWGADLRPANIGSAIPSYQRIADQYTYDSNGFPSYLRFDGVDDSMYTPASIPFATVTSDGLARRNLLSNPTQFDATGSWTKNAPPYPIVTANTDLAPDGTMTMDTVTGEAGLTRYLQQTVSVSASTTYAVSIYIKSGTSTRSVLRVYDSGITTILAGLNIDWSGTAPAVGTTSGTWVTGPTITAAENGTYRVVGAFSSGANTSVAYLFYSDNSATGSGTVKTWGAQLETGSTATAFQNIGTDKMSVFAGVRKLSDAAQAVLLETSVGYGANNGAFISQFLGTSAQVGVRGNANNARSYSGFGAPSTDVLAAQLTTAAANSSAAVSVNVDGIFVAGTNDTSAISTGNFGTYPLYIGSRANTSLFFNGHLYSLITAGTQLQSGSITATEQYVAGKTGVQI